MHSCRPPHRLTSTSTDNPSVGRTAPTLEDAERAARALVSSDGVAEVLVYGSVARGEQDEYNDIDLVVIFDDLDYTAPVIARRATETAERLAGRRCDVYVTDYPEWSVRSEHVTHSFEYCIATEARSLVEIARHSSIHWSKEIELPSNNIDEANHRLLGASGALDALGRGYDIDPDMSVSSAELEPEMRKRMLVANAKHCCGAAAMAMETSAKSLIVVMNEKQAPREHHIHLLLDELGDALVVEQISRLALEHSIDITEIGEWRQAQHYPEKLTSLGGILMKSSDKQMLHQHWLATFRRYARGLCGLIQVLTPPRNDRLSTKNGCCKVASLFDTTEPTIFLRINTET